MTGSGSENQEVIITKDLRFRAACRLLHNWGNTSTSHLTLQPTNRLFFEKSGEAYLAYRIKLGTAITVGDPVGSPQASVRCVLQFIEQCRKKNISPVFFMIQNRISLYPRLGLKGLRIAEDIYLDLDKLQFKGKPWQDVRTALNRARREKINFHQFDPAGDSGLLFEQFQKISKDWLHYKKLPEMGFTLGAVDTVREGNVRTYFAANSPGQVQGFVSWHPIYASHGWVLDLMRKKKGAMPGLMEFLIAHSARLLKEEGYSRLSLGASPLPSDVLEDEFSGKGWLLSLIKNSLQDYYNFDGLYAFKQKFQPERKPLYLFYPGWSSLTRSGIGLMWLFLGSPRLK